MLILILVVTCFLFNACDAFVFTPSTPIEISGIVVYNQEAMSGVVIKSKTQSFYTTNNTGTFSFSAPGPSVTIFAEKSGYTFSPRSINLTQNTENIVFVAEPIHNLNGKLKLKSIVVVPTSIVSVLDNYKYVENNKDCLKLKTLKLYINGNNISDVLNNSVMFASKNENNVIGYNGSFEIEIGKKFNIEFALDAYFKSYGEEYTFHEEHRSVLLVPATLTTQLINNDNLVEFTAIGINSSNAKFTYNISFLFENI